MLWKSGVVNLVFPDSIRTNLSVVLTGWYR